MVSAGNVVRASDVAVQACRVTRTAVQSIPDAAETLVAFTSEDFDTDGMHDTATNNSRITINTAGIYTVSFTGELVGDPTLVRSLATIFLNGTTIIAKDQNNEEYSSGTIPIRFALSVIYQFDVSDYITVSLFQDNTGSNALNLSVISDFSPAFAAARIGS